MVIAFYALVLFVVVVLLIYAILFVAPIVYGLILGFWSWWVELPVHASLIAPLAELAQVPVGDYWNPWGAAVALTILLLAAYAVVRYTPKFIVGEL